MRRTHVMSLPVLIVALASLAAPTVEAGSRGSIEFTDTRTIGDTVGSATTSLAGCEEATTVDLRTHIAIMHGAPSAVDRVFVGIRDFQCDDDSGFVVRLTAKIPSEGDTSGTWSIVSSYGDLRGLRGTGGLVGTHFPGGVVDHYSGSITAHN